MLLLIMYYKLLITLILIYCRLKVRILLLFMITIKQQTAVSFHHVDVKDAVIMAPVMNRLSECVAMRRAKELIAELPKEEKEKYNHIYNDNILISSNEVKAVFDVLSAIGFVATEEYSAEDILAKHLKKD